MRFCLLLLSLLCERSKFLLTIKTKGTNGVVVRVIIKGVIGVTNRLVNDWGHQQACECRGGICHAGVTNRLVNAGVIGVPMGSGLGSCNVLIVIRARLL